MDNFSVQTCVPAELEKKIFMLRCGALDINSAEALEMVEYMRREEQTNNQLRWALLDAVAALQKQVNELRSRNGKLRTENAELLSKARRKPSGFPRRAG